jgi:hypothetical protein
MTDASGSATWKYDNRGRVTEETKSITGSGTFVTKWGYNSDDQVAWMKYPANNTSGIGEHVDFSYHPQGWLDGSSGTAVSITWTVRITTPQGGL